MRLLNRMHGSKTVQCHPNLKEEGRLLERPRRRGGMDDSKSGDQAEWLNKRVARESGGNGLHLRLMSGLDPKEWYDGRPETARRGRGSRSKRSLHHQPVGEGRREK